MNLNDGNEPLLTSREVGPPRDKTRDMISGRCDDPDSACVDGR